MTYTEQHAGQSKVRVMRHLRNDAGTIIQTQEENAGEKRAPEPFPGEGIRADGSAPKRDTTKDTDEGGKLTAEAAKKHEEEITVTGEIESVTTEGQGLGTDKEKTDTETDT